MVLTPVLRRTSWENFQYFLSRKQHGNHFLRLDEHAVFHVVLERDTSDAFLRVGNFDERQMNPLRKMRLPPNQLFFLR